MLRKLFLLGLTALLIAGCGRDEGETEPTPAPEQESADLSTALFERIDADTPWLLANTDTVPEDLVERMWAPLGSMSEFNEQTYSSMADEVEDDSAIAAALLRELAAIDSKEAFTERGLHPNGYYALHGVSIYPFMHWQLSDAEAFRATLERIAANADVELPWRTIDDREVLWVPMEQFGFALAHDEQFATAAIIPDNMALLRRVAGLDEPAESYDPDALAAFGDERGFTPYGTGFIEFDRVISELLDGDDEMLAMLREDSPLGAVAEDEACRNELDALVRTFPRMSLGYSELSAEAMTFDAAIETSPSFAERLVPLADTPVSLDSPSDGGLLDFGLALNIVAARDLAREIVAGWVESPPQCMLFDNIRDNAEDWQLALNQPIPPMVTNFNGLRLGLQDIQMGEDANVESAEATVALFMRNPQMLMGMAQMFSPEMAAMQLEPGGEPQRLPEGAIPNMPVELPAFVALGESAIGLAIGENQADRLPEAMESGEGGSAILSYGIDFAGYAEALDSLMEGFGAQFQDMDEADMEAAGDPGEAMAALAEIYGYSHSSIHLTERGIEFRSSMTLAD
jgi:hypothetical protein